MSKLIILGRFDNVFDIKFNLLKGLLDEAGIPYLTSNENYRTVKSVPFMTPANVSIDIRVEEADLEEAMNLYHSIV